MTGLNDLAHNQPLLHLGGAANCVDAAYRYPLTKVTPEINQSLGNYLSKYRISAKTGIST